ncbi:MAG TPA: hypothetical protein VK706_10260 [Candidatus Sulfotelmatobacter sp.]|nr:hypothetical protein [Candidatus Sulfotelmatobacter sp.]
MNHTRSSLNRQWLLPLEYENTIVLSEDVRAEAIRTLADLLLEAVGQMAIRAAKEEKGDEPKNQA